jgi:hypothetical protein
LRKGSKEVANSATLTAEKQPVTKWVAWTEYHTTPSFGEPSVITVSGTIMKSTAAAARVHSSSTTYLSGREANISKEAKIGTKREGRLGDGTQKQD